MRATISGVGVEFRLWVIRGCFPENLVRPLQLSILALQLLKPRSIIAREAGPLPLALFRAAHPVAKRLAGTANLLRDGPDRGPLG